MHLEMSRLRIEQEGDGWSIRGCQGWSMSRWSLPGYQPKNDLFLIREWVDIRKAYS